MRHLFPSPLTLFLTNKVHFYHIGFVILYGEGRVAEILSLCGNDPMVVWKCSNGCVVIFQRLCGNFPMVVW